MCIPVTDLLRVHSFNPQFTNLSGTIFTGALIVWTGCVCFCVCSSWLDISFISQGSRYSPFLDLFGPKAAYSVVIVVRMNDIPFGLGYLKIRCVFLDQ